MKVAVVGAGWAGLAAAIRARQAGHEVSLYEAAPMPGGRARSDRSANDDADAGATADNGQHILLGGYARTLALMRDVGVDVEAALLRRPLAMTWPDGGGFALPPTGNRLVAAMRALLSARGFTIADKLCVVALSIGWQARRFRAPADLTVDALLRRASPRVRARLLDPLCISALNTPCADASAAVFLAVLRDSLFGERAASDLLLPQVPLARLLPLPAVCWLEARGVAVHLRCRVAGLGREGDAWALDVGMRGPAQVVDRVIVATPAPEAARLTASIAPAWSALAGGLAHEPIVTVTLDAPRRAWPSPMLALDSDDHRLPAQFAFKLGAQPERTDRVTLVVSAAGTWLSRGADVVATHIVQQYRDAFAIGADEPVACLDVRADRRATFRCNAGVVRPPLWIADGMTAAADYVEGPYPATLEAAVIAGEAAAAALETPPQARIPG